MNANWATLILTIRVNYNQEQDSYIMYWLAHLDNYEEICDCRGQGVDCDGQFTFCHFGNIRSAQESRKFEWMRPHVKQYNVLRRLGMNEDAEMLKNLCCN